MTGRRTYFLSTPIYYVNDVPHVGHAYTTIAADTLTRARRLQGKDAFFLTGTDEHGQNIERTAREKGVPTQEYCDQIAGVFRRLWERLDVRYDRFIRTTDDLHVRGVLKLWQRVVKAKTPDGRDAIGVGCEAIGASASIKSGYLTPQIQLCMPPMEFPITSRRCLMPSPSFTSR